jgi:hypothetical protein
VLLTTIALGSLVLVLGFFAWRFSMESTRLCIRYAGIVDLDAAVTETKKHLAEKVRSRFPCNRLRSFEKYGRLRASR